MFTDDYGNIRYRGTTPNNYVYFNCSNMSGQSSSTCEIWRIIGIVDGYVKLMREASIGSYSWDSSDSSVNNGWGINEWNQADLMTSKNMIQEATWYLGGCNTAGVTTSVIYEKERGTTVVQNPSDGIPRTTSWIVLVGLMYQSDYGYSASSSCSTNTDIYSYDEDNKACVNTSWVYATNGGNTEWFITLYSGDDRGAFELSVYGEVVGDSVYHYYRVRPVIYLKSSVKVKGGTGASASTAYQLEA